MCSFNPPVPHPTAAANHPIKPTFNYSANKRVACTTWEALQHITTTRQHCNVRRHRFNYRMADIEYVWMYSCECARHRVCGCLSAASCMCNKCNCPRVCHNMEHSRARTPASALWCCNVCLVSVLFVPVSAVVARFDCDYCGKIFNICWC